MICTPRTLTPIQSQSIATDCWIRLIQSHFDKVEMTFETPGLSKCRRLCTRHRDFVQCARIGWVPTMYLQKEEKKKKKKTPRTGMCRFLLMEVAKLSNDNIGSSFYWLFVLKIYTENDGVCVQNKKMGSLSPCRIFSVPQNTGRTNATITYYLNARGGSILL
jgi:hypothetical protein